MSLKIGDKVRIKIFPHDTIYTVTGMYPRCGKTYYFLDNTELPFMESELEVNMTHELYRAKAQNIDIQIAHLYQEKRQLLFEYIEERRMINAETDVIFEGKKYWFTGNCEIDANGNLLYELDGKSRFLLYKLFEDFEVVE